jgi:hypothetical protein
MNHEFWITKNAKKLQRKLNAKEDENIVHRFVLKVGIKNVKYIFIDSSFSDLELDSKLELFISIGKSYLFMICSAHSLS